jgi:thiamine pyrophosphokinase
MPALEQRVNAKILDPNNKIYLKNQSFTIKKDEQYGDYISLLPFSSKIEELTLRGFKYPLDGITLRAGSSLAISNEIMDEVAYVEFKEGILVVFETRD